MPIDGARVAIINRLNFRTTFSVLLLT